MYLIASISICLFLAVVLLTNNTDSLPKKILGIWLLFSAYYNWGIYLWAEHLENQYPSIIVSGFSMPLLFGPFLFWYVKFQTSDIGFTKKEFWHLTPYLLISLSYISYFFQPFEHRANSLIASNEGLLFRNLVRATCIYFTIPLYFGWCALKIFRFQRSLKNNFSNADKIHFNWILFLMAGILVIWAVVVITQNEELVTKAIAVFLILLGYFGITQVDVFSKRTPQSTLVEEPKVKYVNSGLDDTELVRLHKLLIEILQTEKPYLNPELTLQNLASTINIPVHHLSQVINEKEQKNFYDLINEWRIQEFLREVKNEKNKNYTLIAIAYDCGFNSKASFNRNFKKYTGKTPTEYLTDAQ
ncbi:helix-turn-helix domain-containing protein [Emticicia aquatilis]|nr:helix-turn-helix domain-containing protein [Emticicia aquatilis]